MNFIALGTAFYLKNIFQSKLPPFAYEKVEIFIKISSLKEADNILKNIISGQNGVFVIFNKRRNRIGKPLMRGNFENAHSSIIKRHLSYLD